MHSNVNHTHSCIFLYYSSLVKVILREKEHDGVLNAGIENSSDSVLNQQTSED